MINAMKTAFLLGLLTILIVALYAATRFLTY